MEYFDSDVIFNFLVLQDESKHQEARNLVFNAIKNNQFVISTLVIQEVGYGLARYGLSNEEIEVKLNFLSSQNILGVEPSIIPRAITLAKKIDFKHINDCVHTVIAENLNPEIFYTYNKSDFKRIKKHTKVKIKTL